MNTAIMVNGQVGGDLFLKNLCLRTHVIHGNAKKARKIAHEQVDSLALFGVLKIVKIFVGRVCEDMHGEKRVMFESLIHDLRSVLSAVSGYTDLALCALAGKNFRMSKGYIGDLEIASNETMHLVLDAQESHGMTSAQTVPFALQSDYGPYAIDIRDVITRAIKTSASKQIGGEPYVNILSSVHIHRYAGELRRILTNVLENAYDAMAAKTYAKGCAPSLKIYADVARGSLLDVEVQDNGIGMSDSVLNRVFEKDFTTKGHRGKGIGLHYCKRILEGEIGGEFAIESKEGVGTRVNIRFPIPTKENM